MEDPNQHFCCAICTELPIGAVQTQCCGQIMCQKCSQRLTSNNQQKCPYCRQQFLVRQSSYLRRIISQIKTECPFGCGKKMIQKDLIIHKQYCPSKLITCKICNNQMKIMNFSEHMINQHSQKLTQVLVKFNNLQNVKINSSQKNQFLMSQTVNASGRTCKIGKTGKYYCNGKLIGLCKCCNGFCGPTNGQNCDDCMKVDVDRFNLPKGYLLSTDCVISKYHQKTHSCFCGRLKNDKSICTNLTPCQSCHQVTKSIRLGRYQKLI